MAALKFRCSQVELLLVRFRRELGFFDEALRLDLLDACVFAAPHFAGAQENCQPITFPKGQTSTTIKGVAPASGPVCYTFNTDAGRTAKLKVAGTTSLQVFSFPAERRDAAGLHGGGGAEVARYPDVGYSSSSLSGFSEAASAVPAI